MSMVTHFVTLEIDLQTSPGDMHRSISHFVTLEIDLQTSPGDMHRSILATLQTWGEPLRWAITAVDSDRQMVQIEAVVTTTTEFLIPPSSVKTA